MTSTDIFSILPLIILSASAIIIMLTIAVKRNHYVIFCFSLIGLCAAFFSLFNVPELIPYNLGTLLLIDNYTLFFWGLLFLSGILITLISFNALHISDENKEEYYILIFTAILGSSVLVASINFVTMFIGLEILSVSLYVLISYLRKKEQSIEAGVKYLILAAAASGFLLFGIALIYAEYGTMDFYKLSNALSEISITPIAYAGMAFLIVGIGFKLAVVPFHMWTPDVYEGASSPITAFIATVSKGGMFALLLRFFTIINGYQYDKLMLIFGVIAVASMFAGNWLALFQLNVKRILAYSSIAHLGYLMVAFLAGGNLAAEAVAFYLTAYFITTIGAFGVISFLSNSEKEASNIEDYKGLFWKHPWLSVTFTAMLLSLAGIPLTAGFIGKYYVLTAGVSNALWGLVIVLVINSAIGLYYYLRIIVQMFTKSDENKEADYSFSYITGFSLVVLTFLLIILGTYPSGIIEIIKSMVTI